jgi:hypothetical protein
MGCCSVVFGSVSRSKRNWLCVCESVRVCLCTSRAGSVGSADTPVTGVRWTRQALFSLNRPRTQNSERYPAYWGDAPGRWQGLCEDRPAAPRPLLFSLHEEHVQQLAGLHEPGLTNHQEHPALPTCLLLPGPLPDRAARNHVAKEARQGRDAAYWEYFLSG